MHNVENINESRRKCTLCTYESSKEEMLLHFQEVHDVKIENVELSFIDFESFNEWKNGIEKETKSACSIKFCKTHLEHRNDIGHIKDFERQYIATTIASKIPFDEILDEIRDSVTDSKLERLHLLTKRDLYNIENCFNIGSNAIKHKDDGTSNLPELEMALSNLKAKRKGLRQAFTLNLKKIESELSKEIADRKELSVLRTLMISSRDWTIVNYYYQRNY
ncbi:hypothetical protein TNCV_3330931 [Trichonephila clavipes]|nr:hypothetical protein TNCV_3330931 [Trichonephila clavipes]